MIDLDSEELPVWVNLGIEVVSLSQIEYPVEFSLSPVRIQQLTT